MIIFQGNAARTPGALRFPTERLIAVNQGMIVIIGIALVGPRNQFRLLVVQHPDQRIFHREQRGAKFLQQSLGAVKRGDGNDLGGFEVDAGDKGAGISQGDNLFHQDGEDLFATLGA